MNGPLVVVGDAILDRDVDGEATRLAPDAPAPVVERPVTRTRPGGAALAAALAAADGGRDVVLVTALGEDEPDRAVREHLAGRVGVAAFPLRGSVPVKTRVRAGGRPLVRIDEGGGTPGVPGEQALRALREAGAVLVADYGGGTAAALAAPLAQAAGRVPLLWDPHPRGTAPVAGARLITPNAVEARLFAEAAHDPSDGTGGTRSGTGAGGPDGSGRGGTASGDPGSAGSGSGTAGTGPRDGDRLRDHAERAAALARHWRATAVAITLGERGALLSRGPDSPVLLPAPQRAGGDACGAGDRFAATAVRALADGALPEEAVQRAVADATAFVASGGAGKADLWRSGEPAGTKEPAADAFALAESVRARGGTVVATGGCFDLLHAGHVGLLESARRIGDCLIVCLNSDASVTRLKGPGRPLVPAGDRTRVLAGLACVDAVAVFDEPTPRELLCVLRPDVWVKGGDYTADALPEADALRAWGGQAVVLPYLDGRSTTALARRAAHARTSPPRARA